jgi:hypothetical protein
MSADLYTVDRSLVQDPPTGFRGMLRYLGPGFILSASIVGSGELIATTTLGAKAGFVAAISVPLPGHPRHSAPSSPQQSCFVWHVGGCAGSTVPSGRSAAQRPLHGSHAALISMSMQPTSSGHVSPQHFFCAHFAVAHVSNGFQLYRIS